MARFDVLATAVALAMTACSGDRAGVDASARATWTWSFAGGACPALVTTVHISVTQTQVPGGDCAAQTVTLADVTAPCADGSAALSFVPSHGFNCPLPAPVLTLDALTDDGGAYASDTRVGYDLSDGHSDLPSGLGMVKLVWTLENGSGSAAACPTTIPPARVATSLGGAIPCTNGSGYLPGQLPGTYDTSVTLVAGNSMQVGAGSATITVVADSVTTTPVVITLSP